ncbi:hypothetical protein M8998_00335 [Sphingobacterium sp. lm-10]|uniref:hypothetical protein n=1 Tax=Sphingobacterium sp. lm-10 TaxID=2944904 RepID=UPI002020CBBE|nr:hypothetical protein [Sphingobacterium sp. lm-10]MCL7986379.1 hypothetical protein [Sphingobacterium sp. lm-10]
MTKLFRKSILLFCLIATIKAAPAQQKTNEAKHLTDHKSLMNDVWETFDMLMYKVTTENGKKVYTPYFPPKLSAMNGKTVILKGYVIPIKAGIRHNKFLLSVLPIDQCMFCGQNGIPAMIEVTLSDDKKIRASERPIQIKGKTVLNKEDKSRVEILINNAQLMGDLD